MSDWLTYTLSDFLLFSDRTYYRLFELYNLAIWPAQVVALVVGLGILVLWWRGGEQHGRIVAVILAACWLFVAVAYLWSRYDTINWAGRYFAAGFALQALLLVWAGIIRNRLVFRSSAGIAGWGSLAIFAFALCIQPLTAPLSGRPWTQVELFGIAPDPTAVATLGVLAAVDRPPILLFILPVVWCAVSGVTLWTMESPDALITPAAAILALIFAGRTALRAPG